MITVSSKSEIEAGGLDQRYRAKVNGASNIIGHFHPDPNGGGWVNDRGLEPLIPADASVTFTTSEIPSALAPVRFLSVISRHNGGEVYYLYEQNGALKYDHGNKGIVAGQRQTSVLETGRNLPKPDDCGTQISTYGRFNIVINGINRMLKWWGRELVSNFGFVSPTPSPVISNVQPNYIAYADIHPPGPFQTWDSFWYKRLENGNTCIRFDKDSYYGLGDTAEGALNRFDYRISFVSDTGSESPLSNPVSTSWRFDNITALPVAPVLESITSPTYPKDREYYVAKYGVYISDLPTGPQGTVARRIYRTRNRKDGLTGAGEIFYLVKQINNNADSTFIDITPDQDLNVPAPASTESVTISSQWKYCATWNNSVWLAGGSMNPYGIIYSKAGLPEQFSAGSTFDVGLREGGAITALQPFYDVLLVFRERSIEIITYNNGGYSISTLDSNVGTTATNTIRIVAGIGVMFLNKDGVFAISGSVRGGAVYQVKKMSEQIEKEMSRVSLSAMARATATYSEREKEYWVHYPVDGDTENTRGSVYHTYNGEWSFRGSDGIYEDGNGMPYTYLATDQNGWIIVGLKPTVVPDALGRRGYPGVGLQVWSASRFSGSILTNPVVPPQGATTTYTVTNVAKETDLWESTWQDFGDDTKKKRVLYVEVEVITSGENAIQLDWATDWGYTYTSSGGQKPLKSENIGKLSSEATYGTAGGNPAIWNTSVWSQSQITRLRWDIGSSLIGQFKFKLSSSNMFQVLSYRMEAVGSQQKVINQVPSTPRQ